MLTQRTGGNELPKGLDAAWDVAAGYVQQTVPRSRLFLRRAAEVLAMEAELARLSDQALREECLKVREHFLRGRETPEILKRAFAIIREVDFRQIGERPFLVQVAGAMAIEAGNFTEMATGEGKTLTATMPATVGGWRGKGCHIITTNDYLARRDAEWMKRVYNFCGLTVSAIQADMEPADRRQAYLADITYCTNKEVTADYLRDRLTLGRLQGLSAVILTRIVDGQGSGCPVRSWMRPTRS
jgi:preprotein translocase subunit SecA